MKSFLILASATAAFAAVVAVTAQTQQQAPALRGFSVNPLATRPPAGLPPFKSPDAMQAEFVRRFEASPGFGLSRVMRPIFLAPVPALVWNSATYRVEPPALIGLEDDPIAYAPRENSHRYFIGDTNQSRREVRKLFTHRPLTALETNAILALREGRDLVVLTNLVVAPEAEFERLATAPDLLAVGALRAGRDCAACHQCKEGSLLGAFAYTLTPLSTPEGGPARSNVLARLTSNRLAPGRPLVARSRL